MAAAVESAASDENATGNTMTITKPTGTVEGDLLLYFGANDIDEDALGWDDYTNAWDQVAFDQNAAGRMSSATILSRVAGASEPSDYTFRLGDVGEHTDQNSGLIVRISGQHATWLDTVTAWAERANDATPASVNFTPTQDNCLVLQVLFSVQANAIDNSDAPSGYTGQVRTAIPGSVADQPVISVAYLLQTTATATGTADWWASNTSATVDSNVIGIAIASAAGGGTQFDVNLSGATSPAATLARQAGKAVAGSATSSATVARQTGKPLAGAGTSSGALTRQAGKALAGALASSGALTTIKAVLRSFAGAMDSAGSLTRQTAKPLSGSTTSSGALARLAAKAFVGTATSSGALSTARVVLLALTGAMASTGALTRRPGKALSGASTPSGTLATAATFRRALTGAMASTGALTRRPGKALAGVLTSSGAMSSTRVVLLTLTGAMASTGGLVRRTSKTLAGALVSAAVLSVSGGSTPTGWSWLLRRGGVSQSASAKLDGVHATTTDVT